jgi:hypothetical protein
MFRSRSPELHASVDQMETDRHEHVQRLLPNKTR